METRSLLKFALDKTTLCLCAFGILALTAVARADTVTIPTGGTSAEEVERLIKLLFNDHDDLRIEHSGDHVVVESDNTELLEAVKALSSSQTDPGADIVQEAIQLTYVSVEEALPVIEALLDASRPEGEKETVHLQAIARVNSILVMGSPDHFEQVKRLVATIDQRPDQVYLSAVIARVRLDDEILDSAALLRTVADIDVGDKPLLLKKYRRPEFAGRVFDVASADPVDRDWDQSGAFLNGYIEALENTQYLQVISRPFVFAANNQSSSIVSGGTITPANGILVEESLMEFEVTPMINPDEEITLDIDIKVNDADRSQGLGTTFRVANRDLVVLSMGVTESEEGERHEQLLFLQPTKVAGTASGEGVAVPQSTTSSLNATDTINPTFGFEEVLLQLTVNPLIGLCDEVTLEIEQQTENITDSKVISNKGTIIDAEIQVEVEDLPMSPTEKDSTTKVNHSEPAEPGDSGDNFLKRELKYLPVMEVLPLVADTLARLLEIDPTPIQHPDADPGKPQDLTSPEAILIGETLIIGDPQLNNLIVGSSEHVHLIDRLLDEIDVRPRQVFVETSIVEVTLSEKMKFGMDILKQGTFGKVDLGDDIEAGADILRLVERPDLDSGINLLQAEVRSSGGVSILDLESLTEKAGEGGLKLYVSALTEISDGIEVLSSPQLIATNNRQSVISPNEEMEFRIKPLINSDDEVTMEIESKFESTGVDKQVQSLHTTVRLPDEGTVVIGGIIREEDGKRKELLLFVRPQIIQDKKEGAIYRIPPAPETYASWARKSLGGDAGFKADADGDGIPNGLEYVFRDLKIASSAPGRLTAPPEEMPADVTLSLEVSADLQSWTEILRYSGGQLESIADGVSIEGGIISDERYEASTTDELFYRYRATQ